jgi:predicted methyltransferase
MPPSPPPLLTLEIVAQLEEARRTGAREVRCSLDLMRSTSTVEIRQDNWTFNGGTWPWPSTPIRERTIYYWSGAGFEPVQRYSGALIKLVPSQWGAPTFEIDGIKMLPTAQVSPFEDAQRKVQLVAPRGKVVLDTCGGLGYFAHWCLEQGAARVLSFEKNADVIWLRAMNPWSPGNDARLELTHGDIIEHISKQPTASIDAILHDPPRFGIAGELYSQAFYDELARVLKIRGLLFHYTGTPNKLTSGRDVPREVTKRLERAGFTVKREGDGLLARRGR